MRYAPKPLWLPSMVRVAFTNNTSVGESRIAFLYQTVSTQPITPPVIRPFLGNNPSVFTEQEYTWVTIPPYKYQGIPLKYSELILNNHSALQN